MPFSPEDLVWIYDRTAGRCHICSKKVARRNYGLVGRRGAWEVDHSNPRSCGGSHRRSNLLPACVSCNRSKGAGTTRQARAAHGRSRRPFSEKEIAAARLRNAGAAGLGGLALGAMLMGPVGAVALGLGGLAIGAAVEVEE